MENKTKHTPGPWVYRPNKDDNWGVVRSADGLPVAQACVGRWSKDFDTHRTNNTDPGEANARLIASAPELLAALEAIIDTCNKIDVGVGPNFERPLYLAIKSVAKAKSE